MPKKWHEVVASEGYLKLPEEERAAARQQYFDEVVAPQVPEDEHRMAWLQFDADTRADLKRQPPTFFERAGSAVKTAAGAVASGLSEDFGSALESIGMRPQRSVMDDHKPQPGAETPRAAVAPEDQEVIDRVRLPVSPAFVSHVRQAVVENPELRSRFQPGSIPARVADAVFEQSERAQRAPESEMRGPLTAVQDVSTPRGPRPQAQENLKEKMERFAQEDLREGIIRDSGVYMSRALSELRAETKGSRRTTAPEIDTRAPGSFSDSVRKGGSSLKLTWDLLSHELAGALGADQTQTKRILEESIKNYRSQVGDPQIEKAGKAAQRMGGGSVIGTILNFPVAAMQAEAPAALVVNFMAEQLLPSIPGFMLGYGSGSALAQAGGRALTTRVMLEKSASEAMTKVLGPAAGGAFGNSVAVVTAALGPNYTEGLEKFGGDERKAKQYAVTKTLAEIPANAAAGLLLGVKLPPGEVSNILGQAFAQGVGGATGAARASMAVGERPDAAELAMEFWGEFAGAPVEVGWAGLNGRERKRNVPRGTSDTGPAPAQSVLGAAGQGSEPTTAPPAAPAPAPEPAGVESMLADPTALWREATARPAILNTIQQVIDENPSLPPEQKAEAADALKEMEANPDSIFGIATARPEVYETIARAATETARVERARGPRGPVAPAAGVAPAAPAPIVSGVESPTPTAPPLTPKQMVSSAFERADREAAEERERQLAALQREAARVRMEEEFERHLTRAEAEGSGLRPAEEVPQTQMEVAFERAGVRRGEGGVPLSRGEAGAGQVPTVAASRGERFEQFAQKMREQEDVEIEPVADSEVPPRLASAASVARAAWGKDVVFYRGPSDVEGAVMPDDPGTIYVNLNAGRSWKKLIGHELLHALKRSSGRKGIYNELLSTVAGVVNKSKAAQNYVGRYEGSGTAEQVEEMVGDIFGDMHADPMFWWEVFKASPRGKVRALVNMVFAALDGMRIKLRIAERREGYDTSGFIRDIEAVRKAVAKAYADWQSGKSDFDAAPARGGEARVLQSRLESRPTESERFNEALADFNRLSANPYSDPSLQTTVAHLSRAVEHELSLDKEYKQARREERDRYRKPLSAKQVRELEDFLRKWGSSIERGYHGLQSRPVSLSRGEKFSKLVERLPRTPSGHLKGAGGRDPKDVWNLVQRMESMAREGAADKTWYTESAEEMLKAFGGNKGAAKIFAQVIAITSANTEVKANFTMADKAMFQYAQGKVISVGTQQVDDKLNDLLYFGIQWEGRKTNTFYTNLTDSIDGVKAKDTTQDRWMAQVGFAKNKLTDAEYTFMDLLTKHVASRVGMTPQQAQAAIWVTQKADALVQRYEERGWHSAKSAQAKRRIALTEAGINYGDLIRGRGWFWPEEKVPPPSAAEARAQGRQVTAEVKPSTKFGIGQAVANLSMSNLQAYQKDALSRVFGKRGPAALMEEMGLDRTKYRIVEGAGGYDGMLAPNEIITLNVDAATAERVAHAWMYIFKQDAVPFFRTDAKLRDDPNAAQAAQIMFSEKLTNPVLRKVYDSLRDQVHPNIGLTKVGDNAIVVVNFRGEDGKPFLMEDAAFVEKIAEAVQNNSLGARINGYGRFGAETAYPFHDWPADREGAGLLASAAGGRPDLHERLRRWADVFGNFAEVRGAKLSGKTRAEVAAPLFSRSYAYRAKSALDSYSRARNEGEKRARAADLIGVVESLPQKLDYLKRKDGTRAFARGPVVGSVSTIFEKGRREHRSSEPGATPVPESVISERLDDLLADPLAVFERPNGVAVLVGKLPDGKFINVGISKQKIGNSEANFIMTVHARDAKNVALWDKLGFALYKKEPLTRPASIAGGEGVEATVSGPGTPGGRVLASRVSPQRLGVNVDQRAHAAATSPTNELPEPTEAQKKAGNYPKGHVRVAGMGVTIENPAGSTRAWKRADGTTGETLMKDHYGYIRGTEDRTGEHVDVFVKEGTPHDYDGPVFVVDQNKSNGRMDEYKVMIGWDSVKGALTGYKQNYSRGWSGHHAISRFDTPAAFREWLANGDMNKRAVDQMLFSRGKRGESRRRDFQPDIQLQLEEGALYKLTREQLIQRLLKLEPPATPAADIPKVAAAKAKEFNGKVERWEAALRADLKQFEQKEAEYRDKEKWTDDELRQRLLLEGDTERFFVELEGESDVGGGRILHSRAAPKRILPGDLAGAWQEVAKDEDVFQRPRSRARGLAQIVRELGPNLELLPGQQPNDTLKRGWQIITPDGARALVREPRPGKARDYYDDIELRRTVEVDLSELRTGQSRGNLIYDIVATYAHNNGMVFIGDRTGISPIGAMRRVENMVSSALKFGTTRHIEPHQFQMRESFITRRYDMKGIVWVPGDDAANLRELLEASHRNVRQNVPEIDSVFYDFYEHVFKMLDIENGSRREMTIADWRKLSSTANHEWWSKFAGQEAPEDNMIFGVNTMKRAAFTNTLLKADDDGMWKETIEAIQRMPEEVDKQTSGMLYSRGKRRLEGAAPRPGARFAVPLEWEVKPSDGDWVSRTGDGRYVIERMPDGYVVKVGGEEVGWYRNRDIAVAVATNELEADVKKGAVKNTAEAQSVLAQQSPEQIDRVARGWRLLAKNPLAFRFTKSDAKDLPQVLKDMGMKDEVREIHDLGGEQVVVFKDTNKEEGDIFVLGDRLPYLEPWASIVHNRGDGTAYVKAHSLVKESGLGTRFYQAVFTWAHNNRVKIVPDPSGLTHVNSFRRTDQMLSAALRFDDTSFMLPHADQGLYGWSAERSANDQNIAIMAVTSMRSVFEAVPRAAELRYDFETRRILDEPPAPSERGDGKAEVVRSDMLEELSVDEGARDIGAGRATILRAIYTNSLLHDPAGAQKAIKEGNAPSAIFSDKLLYSRAGESRFAPKKPGAVKMAALATAKGAVQAARPVGATLDVLNRAADVVMMIPGKPLAAVTRGTLRFITGSRIYDRFIRKRFSGEKSQGFAHGVIADYGLSEPHLLARDDRDVNIQKHLRKSKATLDKIAALDDGESMVAYQWMQEKPDTAEEQRLLNLLPEESRQALAEMKQMLSDLGKEAVGLGLLSEETYQRNNMAYLRRSYQKYELNNPQSVAASTRAKAVRADTFKHRGLRDDVDASRLPGVQKGDHYVRLELRKPGSAYGGLGTLQRVVYLKAGTPIPAAYASWRNDGAWEARFMDKSGTVGMWRDMTEAERERLGEIREVRYAFARSMIGLVHDIETAKFLKWVMENESLADAEAVIAAGGRVASAVDKGLTIKTYANDEWVEVPGTYAQGTRLFKYGALQSRYVPGHVWNDIRATINVRSDAMVGKLYNNLLRAWKISKTALSPTVHTNNIMANFVLADLAEVRHHDILRALRLIIDAQRGDDVARAEMERYLDAGAELGTPALHELRTDVIEPLIRELQGEVDETLAQTSLIQIISLAAHGNLRQSLAALSQKKLLRVAKKPFEVMLSAYQLEDSVFRLAKFLKETDAGVSDRMAGKAAREAFLDYRINAPWIQYLRNGPFPFLAFTYRVVPIMARAMRDKPWKFMKYASAAYGLNALAYAMLGLSGDDEDRERALLPDERQGITILGTPRLMRMPWNDEHGNPVFLDIRRWIPGGDIFDLTASHGAIPMPQWLSLGGYLALMVEMASNRSQFTGKPIWRESDLESPFYSDAIIKTVDHLFKFLAPNIPIPNPLGYLADAASVTERGLLQTYSWRNIEAAGKGVTDDFGRERSMTDALLSSVGVKLASYPADQLRRNLTVKRDMELRGLSEDAARYKREYRRSQKSEDDLDLLRRRMEKQAKKKRDISLRYAERLRGLEPQ